LRGFRLTARVRFSTGIQPDAMTSSSAQVPDTQSVSYVYTPLSAQKDTGDLFNEYVELTVNWDVEGHVME